MGTEGFSQTQLPSEHAASSLLPKCCYRLRTLATPYQRISTQCLSELMIERRSLRKLRRGT
ncbi:MAG: hypothetical protein DRN96_05495 [Thermoproteota archaeon]|nr:MAG: hypothetical protein DRN96_05495 [Candidatus Korarchaeota archaeon]